MTVAHHSTLLFDQVTRTWRQHAIERVLVRPQGDAFAALRLANDRGVFMRPNCVLDGHPPAVQSGCDTAVRLTGSTEPLSLRKESGSKLLSLTRNLEKERFDTGIPHMVCCIAKSSPSVPADRDQPIQHPALIVLGHDLLPSRPQFVGASESPDVARLTKVQELDQRNGKRRCPDRAFR